MSKKYIQKTQYMQKTYAQPCVRRTCVARSVYMYMYMYTCTYVCIYVYM